jgi:hypothetical protein
MAAPIIVGIIKRTRFTVYLFLGLASPGTNLLFGDVLSRPYLQMVAASMPFRRRYINV